MKSATRNLGTLALARRYWALACCFGCSKLLASFYLCTCIYPVYRLSTSPPVAAPLPSKAPPPPLLLLRLLWLGLLPIPPCRHRRWSVITKQGRAASGLGLRWLGHRWHGPLQITIPTPPSEPTRRRRGCHILPPLRRWRLWRLYGGRRQGGCSAGRHWNCSAENAPLRWGRLGHRH